MLPLLETCMLLQMVMLRSMVTKQIRMLPIMVMLLPLIMISPTDYGQCQLLV